MITTAELPLNQRGAVYHLDLLPEELADCVLTVGDPDRVSQISSYFQSIELKRSHREFNTHTGYLNNKRITVLSTGIGIPNIDIVMNELDALVNIDLATRTEMDRKRKLTIIRLGTTGSLVKECSIGDVILSRYALGFDSLMHYYQYESSPLMQQLNKELDRHLNGQCGPVFLSESCSLLASLFSDIGQSGITATCSGFYGPQGRHLRIPLKYPQLINRLEEFKFQNYSILNLEMETAALYAMSSLLGHSCISLSVVLANRVTNTFVSDINACVHSFLKRALDMITQL